MKVTAFIRKTSAKNNVTDLARVYFRVRDIGGVDIKAASELSISPNHWSAEKQGYKPRVALVSEEKRMNFDRDIQQITHLITKEYHRGVDGNWLKKTDRGIPPPRHQRKGRQQSRRIPSRLSDQPVYRRKHFGGRQLQAPSWQYRQDKPLRAFPA
ncbi:MAG: hypothetical protein ACLU1V_16335 [Bacteroides fragilis]